MAISQACRVSVALLYGALALPVSAVSPAAQFCDGYDVESDSRKAEKARDFYFAIETDAMSVALSYDIQCVAREISAIEAKAKAYCAERERKGHDALGTPLRALQSAIRDLLLRCTRERVETEPEAVVLTCEQVEIMLETMMTPPTDFSDEQISCLSNEMEELFRALPCESGNALQQTLLVSALERWLEACGLDIRGFSEASPAAIEADPGSGQER